MNRLLIATLVLTAVCAAPPGPGEEEASNAVFTKDFEIDEKNLWKSKVVDQAAANSFSETSVEFVNKYMIDHKIEPVSLPDEVSDGVKLSGGLLQNLATMHLRGGAHIFSEIDMIHLVNVPLQFHDLKATYDFVLSTGALSISGTVSAHIKDIEVELVVRHDHAHNQLSLMDFEVINDGSIEVSFSNDKIDESHQEKLADVVTKALEKSVAHILETVVEPTMDVAFAELDQIFAALAKLKN